MFISSCLQKKSAVVEKVSSSFRTDNLHSGIFKDEGVKHPDGFKWIFKTGGPVRSTPAVVNNTAYFGSSDGNVYAVDMTAGKEIWRFKSDGAVVSSPTVDDNKIFFTSRSGTLYSLNIINGKLNWKFDLGNDLPYAWGFDYYTSSPVVDDGAIYIGSGDGKFYSISSDKGKVKWTFNCGARIRSTAAVAVNEVLFGDMLGSFYALDKKEGKLLWKFETEGIKFNNKESGFDRKGILSSPAVSEDKVVFGSRDGNIYALNLKTGKEEWKFSHGTSWIITSPALENGVVYAGSSDAHFFQALDLNTGKELWKFITPQAIWSSPAVNKSDVYFADFAGTLYSLNKKNGKQNWSLKLMDCFISFFPSNSRNELINRRR